MATETKRNVTKHSVDNVVVVWLALPMLCLCLACATFQAVGERERETKRYAYIARSCHEQAGLEVGFAKRAVDTGVVLPQPKSSRAWHTATANYRLPVLYQLRSLSFPLRFSGFLFFLSLHLVGFVSRSARNSWFVFNMTRTLLVGSCPLHRFRESNTRARIIFRGKRMV